MANAAPLTLLHLSDVQLGPHHSFERPDAPGGLLHRLREDLERMREEEGLKPDLVLLTGDLTEHGLPSQFTQVLSFAHGLLEVTGLGPRRIVMVPGNHDVNWGLSESYFAERRGNEKEPVRPYWPKLAPYAELLAKLYEGQPGLGFTEVEPWTFYEYPELKVVVAGLDSVIAESHRAEDHYGFLGEPQLDFFAGKLRPYKERGWLRIGAVHHDPLHPENEAAKQDAKDLKGRLLPWLNLVVHGHIHEEQLGWLHATTPVLGIGSAGVKVPQRPPEVPNQYQWVRVFPDRVEYGTRAYVPDQKRWVGCLRSDSAGKAWRLTEKVAFEGVAETFSGTVGEKAPEGDLAAMVDAYRRHWANAYRRETLFDLAKMGEDADIPAGLDLLHIFVPQSVRRALPYGDTVYESDDPKPARIQFAVPTGPLVPIDEIITSPTEPWLLVLGNPGAGKSALTRWIMLRFCVAGERLAELQADLVPMRIELRRFDLQYRQSRAAGRSYDFFDYLDEVHRERHLSLHGDPLRRLADTGRLLYLFDGLDEVADPHTRREYAERIASVKERYGARIIVTSRVVGIQATQMLFQDAGFSVCTLQDFNDEQINIFLERWHRLAFPDALEAGARRLERLIMTLKERPQVRGLCGNPLLLTLIALLNRGAELPRQRHRVYERAVELMADQWEANKGLPAVNATRFDLPIKKRFLRQLAFEMLTKLQGGAGNTVRQRDLVAFASGFCMREYALKAEEAHATAEQLIAHLQERNYILALLGGQTFGFVHKVFLEYLAAVEIVTRFETHLWNIDDLVALFARNRDDVKWDEALQLVCAVLQEEHPETVIRILVSVVAEVEPFGAAADIGYDFARRCFAEVVRIEQEPMKSFALLLSKWEVEPYYRGYGVTDSDGCAVDVDLEELRSLAHANGSDHNRLCGATLLRLSGEPKEEWQPIFEHLARSAKKGSDRLQAAKELLDERRIAQIAQHSKSRKVRADAARALEKLRIYRALLAIGRPRRGIVSLDGTHAGILEETPQGSRFTYDRSYLSSPNPIPLSTTTLPLRPEPFEARGLHPFFENLLPEGWLLDRTCEKLGIDRTDAFGLLLATCADCAGAVEIVPEPPPGLPGP